VERLIASTKAIMDRHDPQKRVGLVLDEWGTWFDVEPGTNPRFLYQQNTIRDALVAALSLNILHTHADRLHIANIAQIANVLQAMVLTAGEKMLLTPTYHVFEMYKVHQGATLLPVEIECADYQLSEGKDAIRCISVSVSRDDAGKTHVSLCNVHHERGAEVTCELRGRTFTRVSGRILRADSINAHNTFEQPQNIKPVRFEAAKLHGDVLTISMPVRSVVMLEVE
jgi:alpha-N-arabinofuranosidase